MFNGAVFWEDFPHAPDLLLSVLISVPPPTAVSIGCRASSLCDLGFLFVFFLLDVTATHFFSYPPVLGVLCDPPPTTHLAPFSACAILGFALPVAIPLV